MIRQLILCENISKTLSILNRKSYLAVILRKFSTHTLCHLSGVTCHMSYVVCPVSGVRYHLVELVGGRSFNNGAYTDYFQSIGPLGQCFLKVEMSVCLCVCLSVCLFTFEVPFNGLFAPTSQSRMSIIFTDSESLGKSNGKKWSNI